MSTLGARPCVRARQLGRDRVEHVPAVVEAGQRIGARARARPRRAPAFGARATASPRGALPQQDEARDCERKRERQQHDDPEQEAGCRDRGRLAQWRSPACRATSASRKLVRNAVKAGVAHAKEGARGA